MSYMPRSKSDIHITPDEVYEVIESKFGYTKKEMFDPCPLNPRKDGLKIPWMPVNFVNPPYGKGIIKGEGITLLGKFVEKAITESFKGNKTVMLLPSKTDQRWFHQLLYHKYEIYWFDHRLKFIGNNDSATQPHFLVYIK